jgi:hypothetical protein
VVDGAATDAGLSQALQGQGKVAPLGMVTISGSIQLPGSIANGRPTGTVTLTNARGSVTLQLIGPVQAELTATPSKFTYTVISGTGTYQGAKGSGHASLREIQVDGSAAQAGGSNQPVVVGSLFILTFSR